MLIGTPNGKKVDKYNVEKLEKKGMATPLDPLIWQPTEKEKECIQTITSYFEQGYNQQSATRVEFNDLSLLDRYQVDKLSFNTYQPNNGDSFPDDVMNAWRSNAMKPVVRNQAMSIAAHTLARNLYPAVEAYDSSNDSQKASAEVMSDLIEYAGDKSNWDMTSMKAVTTALFSPAAIVYTEYADVYRTVYVNGQPKRIKDTAYCGFHDTVVTVDELMIENFYEGDIQKQSWLIWRRTPSYASAKAKYAKYENFKYVKKGLQLIFNDPNQLYYYVYDPQLIGELVEEVLYWNRAEDKFIIMVNGILLTDVDNRNPRLDKQFPFVKFGYQTIDEGRFFYYKSLAFALQQDAKVINTLYPLYVDGAILEYNPPVQNMGGEIVTSDAISPGTVTNFASEGAELKTILPQKNHNGILNAVGMVETSITQTANPPVIEEPNTSATEALIQKQSATTVLDLFIKMVADFVRNYGNLKISDILQYLTVATALSTSGQELTYQSYIISQKNSNKKPRKIDFDGGIPSEMSQLDLFVSSAKIALGSPEAELIKVNPSLFRSFSYEAKVYADTLAPTSSEMERAYVKELFSMLVNNPVADQEEIVRLILENSPVTRKSVDRFIAKQNPMAQAPSQPIVEAPPVGVPLDKVQGFARPQQAV